VISFIDFFVSFFALLHSLLEGIHPLLKLVDDLVSDLGLYYGFEGAQTVGFRGSRSHPFGLFFIVRFIITVWLLFSAKQGLRFQAGGLHTQVVEKFICIVYPVKDSECR
jgi:ABC-type uncharacterized transport system permease subunit